MESVQNFSYGSVEVNYRLVWRKHDVIVGLPGGGVRANREKNMDVFLEGNLK